MSATSLKKYARGYFDIAFEALDALHNIGKAADPNWVVQYASKTYSDLLGRFNDLQILRQRFHRDQAKRQRSKR